MEYEVEQEHTINLCHSSDGLLLGFVINHGQNLQDNLLLFEPVDPKINRDES